MVKILRTLFFVMFLCFAVFRVDAQHTYETDILGKPFESLTIEMADDYEGRVVSTLVRLLPRDTTVNKAVLYVHGFNDYFFQTEMAQRYNEHGIAFFAVDLRKYGRSFLPHQTMTHARSLTEYFPEIDSCLTIMDSEGYDTILLSGHSTGGLTVSLFADAFPDHPFVDALFVNSPFYGMNAGFFTKNILFPIVALWGEISPMTVFSEGGSTLYGESIHADFRGEWTFNTDWKKLKSQTIHFGWLNAIYEGHQRVEDGLKITVPTLVMHSDSSYRGNEWNWNFTDKDVVLNIDDIVEGANNIEAQEVKIVPIENGLHDLILSRKEVREEVYHQLFDWINTQF